ncbi:MAG: hypothetical protein S4CHLAM20_01070 [Chlamydiia bacterium]|nr:hypothetical protein [Chlamydiia bacterium]
MNKEKQLLQNLARLESQVDALESEVSHLDVLLRQAGFPEGLDTLRSTVEELLTEVEDNGSDDDLSSFFA